MAIAGKVAITLSNENDGKWSESVTYDRLTAVTHNNNLYISKKPSTNVEPTVTDEFWFLALKGFGGEDVQALIDRMNELSDLIQAIIDGTTQVGNAKTFDGHEAEYFFPKSGGTINGKVRLEAVDATIIQHRLKNSERDVFQQIDANGVYQLYDATNGQEIIRSYNGITTFGGTASGNLPLTGGMVKGDIDFKPDGVTGFGKVGKWANANVDNGLVLRDEDKYGNIALARIVSGHGLNGITYEVGGVTYTLLHTGNKPTGTYTGNGSATARRIAIGGIGDVVVLTSVNGSAIVTVGGTTINSPSGGVSRLSTDEVKAINGYLNLSTTNSIVNGNGVEVTYRVL